MHIAALYGGIRKLDTTQMSVNNKMEKFGIFIQ